ncbi:MAG: chorismate mutase [Alphaproteobacteria bacterium]|nr:chorismate mutase [Alphaproteobacteria bacterium]
MSDTPYQSPRLDDIRKRIDSLDSTIHDALMERATLVLEIGEEKRKNNIQVVQPAREARMIRRLLGRHKGVLPEMAVVRIWRELVGAVSLLQTGLKVAVCVTEGRQDIWDMARDYFGSCLPMSKVAAPLSAIGAVREGKATFAVLPWPENEEDQPWWAFLRQGSQDEMNIIIRLPHGDDPEGGNPDNRALVVSKSGFDDSGDDHSFLLIECHAGVSRARLVDMAKKNGLVPVFISSQRSAKTPLSLHLMEVSGYIGKEDHRLKLFAASLEDDQTRITCIGGYPVPMTYAKTVQVKTGTSEENK